MGCPGETATRKGGAGALFAQFRPHPVMKTWLYVISFGILFLSVLPWSIPLALALRRPEVFWSIGVGVHVAVILVSGWLVYWVPRYYGSIAYGFDPQWLSAEGGVVWRKRQRLPMGRVQMVEVVQGPWQRGWSVSTLRVHTAASGQATAELTYLNVEKAEEVRDRILRLVDETRPDETGLDQGAAGGELTQIARRLLEEVRGLKEALRKGGGE